MCLIIVAKSGTKKYSDFMLDAIKRASISNTDGMGYSFKRDKNKEKVWISKGYKDIDKFIKSIKNKRLKDEDELIIHLRIGNKGAKTSDMNHPFVISNDTDEILSNEKYVTKPTVCHNGTFYDYSVINSSMSDTFFFVQKFLSVPEIQQLLKRDLDLFKITFKEILKSNRLALIFAGENSLITLGDFKEDEGYLFSNESYKVNKYRNVGGQEEFDLVDRRYGTPQGTPNNYGRPRNAPPIGFNLRNSNIPTIEELQAQREQKQLAAFNAGREESDNHKNEEAEERELARQNARVGNVVSAGIRNRDTSGFLTANPKFDICPGPNHKVVFDKKRALPYFGFFSNSIFVSKVYTANQFKESKFMPRSFNYKHFMFVCTCVAGTDVDAKLNTTYIMTEYDEAEGDYHKQEHQLSVMGEEEIYNKKLYVSNDELVANFRVYPRELLMKVYNDVFRLMQAHDNVSKNNYSNTARIIRDCTTKKEPKLTGILYKKTINLELMALKIYNNYLYEALFGEEQSKQYTYKVQAPDIYVN